MGIVEEELGSASLSTGSEVTIEYNDNGSVHLHVGDFRFDFTVQEFDEFAEAVTTGKRELTAMKDGV